MSSQILGPRCPVLCRPYGSAFPTLRQFHLIHFDLAVYSKVAFHVISVVEPYNVAQQLALL